MSSFETLGRLAMPIALSGPVVGTDASAYGAALSAVGLHPDNPEGMYAQLMAFLANPVKFKNADPCWPGKRDAYVAYDKDGTLVFEWPFGGGKWLSEAPHSDAQVRAVYKIPAGQATLPFMKKLYKSNSNLTKWTIDAGRGWWCPSGGFDLGKAVDSAVHAVQQGVGSVVDVANTLRIPGVNLTTALLTGKDLGAALHQDIVNFSSAANLAKNVASGNMGAVAADLTGQAAKMGVSLPPDAVQAAVGLASSAASGAPVNLEDIAKTALGPHYQDALNVATHFGTATAGTVHPLTVAAKAIPLHLALAKTPLKVPANMTLVHAAAKASTAVDTTDHAPFVWASAHV